MPLGTNIGPGSPTYKRREGSKMPQKTSTKFLDRNYAGDSNAMSLSIQKLKTLSATFLYKGHELDSRHAAGETGDSSTTGIVEPNALGMFCALHEPLLTVVLFEGYINDNKWCAMAGIASTLVKMYIRYKNSRPQPPELNMVRAKVCSQSFWISCSFRLTG